MPREYPNDSLPKVISRIQRINNENDQPLANIVELLGFGPLPNGAAHSFLCSAETFGLMKVDFKSRTARRTPAPTSNFRELQQIALSPPLFKKMHDHFAGDEAPGISKIDTFFTETETNLSRFGIRTAANSYYETMKYVNTFCPAKITYDRLWDQESGVTIIFPKSYKKEELLQQVSGMICAKN